MHVLSGPDGSRHSSDQHPKNVNSENSNYCQFLSGNFCPPEGKLPRCGISAFLQCLNFRPSYRETPEPPGDGNSNFFVFFVFCGLKLLRACLKAPALTGYVGDAQCMYWFWPEWSLQLPFYSKTRRPKPIHQCSAKRSLTNTWEALWCICFFPSFPLKTSIFGTHQPLFLPDEALEFSELNTPLVWGSTDLILKIRSHWGTPEGGAYLRALLAGCKTSF